MYSMYCIFGAHPVGFIPIINCAIQTKLLKIDGWVYPVYHYGHILQLSCCARDTDARLLFQEEILVPHKQIVMSLKMTKLLCFCVQRSTAREWDRLEDKNWNESHRGFFSWNWIGRDDIFFSRSNSERDQSDFCLILAFVQNLQLKTLRNH